MIVETIVTAVNFLDITPNLNSKLQKSFKGSTATPYALIRTRRLNKHQQEKKGVIFETKQHLSEPWNNDISTPYHVVDITEEPSTPQYPLVIRPKNTGERNALL